MITFGLVIRFLITMVIFRAITEINMFRKKQKQKEALDEYNQYLVDYAIEKNKYDIACGKTEFNISSEIDKILNDYKDGCRTMHYCDDYSYKGLWENNTQNGFGQYMRNDAVLVSGNRKQNKYHGLMKIHIEDSPGNMVSNYHCTYNEGKRDSCYIKYKDSKLYEITDAKLNELHVFDFIQM
jgi:hypothetical protein